MGKNQDAVWGAKASPEVSDLLDALFERSGYTTKKEYLEHLARLDKANQIKVGTDSSLPPELLKLSSGDLSELVSYSDGINKLYIRMIERTGLREHSLLNDRERLEVSIANVQVELQKTLQESQESIARLEHELSELRRYNDLLQQENKLIGQERVQHHESLRLKEENIEWLEADLNEKHRRIAELDEKIQSFDELVDENRQMQEDIRSLHQTLKDERKDMETAAQKKDSEYQLSLATQIQAIREAAQTEISKYRDELTHQLRQEMDNLKKAVSEKKSPGRPPKTTS